MSSANLRSHHSFGYFKAIREAQKTPLDRALSVLADVYPQEGVTVLLLSVNVFLILSAYYLLKTVREALILSEGSAEVKTYSAAGQALFLLLVVPAYSAFASRVNRARLITWVTLFFISHIGGFYALSFAGVRQGVAFFLWVGIFNVLVIAQFWAFANDLYTEEQGKRLFPIIALGSSVGALAGAWMASRLVSITGAPGLMPIAGVLLFLGLALTLVVNRRERERELKPVADQPIGGEGAFALIFKDRYLLLIAALTLLLNVVNTSGEFLLGKLVTAEAANLNGEAKQKFIGQFYGDYFGWVNLASLILQAVGVSRIFHFLGVRGALFFLPGIALTSYTLLLLYPVLQVVRIAKIAENATDYSVQNTTRQALFLPLSRKAKYKAKAAIDSFFMRAGDVTQAAIVFAGSQMAFTLQNYAAINVVLVLIWLAVAAGIFREHKKRTESKLAQPVAAAQ
jgi:AAA family ATP:ADP antiporter